MGRGFCSLLSASSIYYGPCSMFNLCVWQPFCKTSFQEPPPFRHATIFVYTMQFVIAFIRYKPKPRYTQFGLNAPCLLRCVLHPVNAYHASHSISGFARIVEWNMWKSIALQLLATVQPSQHCPLRGQPSDRPKSEPVYGKLFTFENLNKMLIFFRTMTPIDLRPSKT